MNAYLTVFDGVSTLGQLRHQLGYLDDPNMPLTLTVISADGVRTLRDLDDCGVLGFVVECLSWLPESTLLTADLLQYPEEEPQGHAFRAGFVPGK